jgi:type 1 glutamine amidotransferase
LGWANQRGSQPHGFNLDLERGYWSRNQADDQDADDATVLLTGTIPAHTHPVAWARTHNGGRVFYTSLGHPEDFKIAGFLRLLVNALAWATKRKWEKHQAQ